MKLFAVLFYVFVAYLLTLPVRAQTAFGLLPMAQLSDGGIWLLMILGLLYNVFIRHRMHRSSHFKKNLPLIVIITLLILWAYQGQALMVAGITLIYWLLVGRTGREAPYFLRFHILTAMILGTFMLLPFLLLDVFLQLLSALFLVIQLGLVANVLSGIILPVLHVAALLVFWVAALYMSVAALMGRTPYINLVTPNVRHWA